MANTEEFGSSDLGSIPYTPENKIGGIRPDIILTNEKGNRLLVEVGVTSFIKGNQKKINEIKRLKIPTIEVNLKELYQKATSIDDQIESELQLILIDSTEKKEWIWNNPNNLDNGIEEQSLDKSDNVIDWILRALGIVLAALVVWWNIKNSPQQKIKKHRRVKVRRNSKGSRKSAKYN